MPTAARVRRLRAPPFRDPPGYGRHRPEATPLDRPPPAGYKQLSAAQTENGGVYTRVFEIEH